MTIPAPTTSARDEVRPVVPKLIELSERVLYGDVWERPGLSKRDRSLITVAALVALYRSDQLRGHLERALANGVTREEIGEVITHLAFYAGWPSAMTAAPHTRRKTTNVGVGAANNTGEAMQHAPLMRSAITAAGLRPKRSDAHPPRRLPPAPAIPIATNVMTPVDVSVASLRPCLLARRKTGSQLHNAYSSHIWPK